MGKVSFRFFGDREVRAVWDDEHSKWRFSVLDIIDVLQRGLYERRGLFHYYKQENDISGDNNIK